MFDRHQRKLAILFAAADTLLTICAFEAAYQTRVALPMENVFFIEPLTKTLLLTLTLLLWLGLGSWIGVYWRTYATDTLAALTDTITQVSFGVLGFLAFQYLIDPNLDVSRLFVVLFAIYNIFFFLTYRLFVGRLSVYLRNRVDAQFHYLVIGTESHAREIGKRLEAARNQGVQLVAFVASSKNSMEQIHLTRTHKVHQIEALPSLFRQNVIDEVIFAVDQQHLSDLEEVFLFCEEEGVRTRIVVDIFPHVHSHIYFDRFSGIPLLTFSPTPYDELRMFIKRAIDVAVSLCVLVISTPVMILIAILVKLTSPGPFIFSQVRCGLNGRKFKFYKVRSMVQHAEDLKVRLSHLNEKDGPVFKMTHDPRVTKVGRYLRKFSIDEFPQFWNILRGDMSLVGPRPAVPSEITHYKLWQRRRLRMRPGLTCLWAIHGRDNLNFDAWMELDLEYIESWSLGLDLKILLQTIPRVFLGRGAS